MILSLSSLLLLLMLLLLLLLLLALALLFDVAAGRFKLSMRTLLRLTFPGRFIMLPGMFTLNLGLEGMMVLGLPGVKSK